MNRKRLNKIDESRNLLPEPGPEVVGELIAELRKAQDHLEIAWSVIALAGVSLGDWNSMPLEWRYAAGKWRDEWFHMLAANMNTTESKGECPMQCEACDAEEDGE